MRETISKNERKLVLLLSLAAFVLSTASLSAQFSFKSQEIRASVLNISHNPKDGVLSITVALANRGGHDAIVAEAYPVSFYEGKVFRSIGPEKSPAALPALLKAGDVAMVTFNAPLAFSEHYFAGEPQEGEGDRNRGLRKVSVGLAFTAMDSEGEVTGGQIAFADIFITNTEWKSFEITQRSFRLI